jgi:hypothetical protein
MLTYEDVLELSELTEEEIEAIAEHERIPAICAAEYGYYLCHSPEGIPMVRRIILDDIIEARRHEDYEKEMKLREVLKHFIRTHPENLTRGDTGTTGSAA